MGLSPTGFNLHSPGVLHAQCACHPTCFHMSFKALSSTTEEALTLNYNLQNNIVYADR